METVRDLGCLQLDPTSAVARSHLLVLWSRLGKFNLAHLEKLLWEERQLFEYWAHAASIVLTEDYPIHHLRMREFPKGSAAWTNWVISWMKENKTLHQYILKELKQKGPKLSREIEDKSVQSWESTGWTNERNVDRMISFLWAQGKLMVAGRKGGQKLWDLAERHLPEWATKEKLTEREVVRRAVQKSLRALGVARARDILQHYTRGRYPNLAKVLAELEKEEKIVRVQVAENKKNWPGIWYMHSDDLDVLRSLKSGDWEPRTTLLSPFDNLICDRARTEHWFDFRFRLEIYVPKAKREYGFFVMPILHGDQLIGRLDPEMNRKEKKLSINAVYAEPNAPLNKETGRAIAKTIEDLGAFLGATKICYTQRVPAAWKTLLR